MLGIQTEQKELFSYRVDLDQRVRKDNPLRKIKERIDFSWVRPEVKDCYGYNGNMSVDPIIIVKMLLLLFLDNVKSERELMRIIPERLDYLWFLGYGLDDEVPDHSVLSKARARWGREVFEKLFVATVQLCLEAGLVEGSKIHADGSLVDADASKDSVAAGPPELIAALKRAYAVQEHKLEGNLGASYYPRKNERLMSTTDPDAPVARQSQSGNQSDSRPRYKHHRAVDDRHGVITAQETTPGDVEENAKLEPLIDQHETNTGVKVKTAVGDKQYGTIDNFRQLQRRGIAAHMDQMHGGPARKNGLYPLEQFTYEAESETYTCPAGQTLYKRRYDPKRQATEYRARKGVCAACPVQAHCTRSRTGRTLMRHREQERVNQGKAESQSAAAQKDRRRRRTLIEGSFGQAAVNHHFKRSRWRRLWNQQIQDALICAVQNIKILIQHGPRPRPAAASPALFPRAPNFFLKLSVSWCSIARQPG